MRFHKVEVDETVFQFVKAHAEPLVDTFNSALRRLLPLSEAHKTSPPLPEGGHPQSHPEALEPALLRHFPQALQQILEVVRLVQSGSYSRPAATQFIARQLDVFPQTILDKYCRQLGLTASDFDRLLEEPGLLRLRERLKKKFPRYANEIDAILL